MISPARKMRLYEEVMKQIIRAVKQDFWSSGQKLPSEEILAREFEVGRSTIREALKSLAISGIVESKPGYGTFIRNDALRKISNMEFLNYMTNDSPWLELVQIRILLESHNVYWAAQNATKDDISVLENVLDNCVDSVLTYSGKDDFMKCNSEFHNAIAIIGGNRLALRLLRSIQTEIDVQRKKYLRLNQTDLHKMVEEHVQIVTLIKHHEPEKAEAAMKEHLISGYEKIVGRDEISIYEQSLMNAENPDNYCHLNLS